MENEKSCLIVIDAQRGFLRSDDTKYLADRILNALRNDPFDFVIGTEFINSPKSLFHRALGWREMEDGPDTDIPEALLRKMDLVIEKNGYSAAEDILYYDLFDPETEWGERTWDAITCLNEGGTAYLCGCDTEACVLATATGLWDHGVRPVILSDLTESNGGREVHEAALMIARRMFGTDAVRDSRDVLREIGSW